MAYRITEEKMESYQEHMVCEEFAPDTIKKYLRDIRAFAAWLEECAAGRQGKTRKIPSGVGQAGAEEVLSGRGQLGMEEDLSSGGQAGAEEVFTGGGGPGAEKKFSAGKPRPDDGIYKSEASLEGKTAVPVDKEASTGWKTHLIKAGYAPATINGEWSASKVCPVAMPSGRQGVNVGVMEIWQTVGNKNLLQGMQRYRKACGCTGTQQH